MGPYCLVLLLDTFGRIMHEIDVRLNGRGFTRDTETLEVDLESETLSSPFSLSLTPTSLQPIKGNHNAVLLN
ncbi:hypothetical protein EYF80_042923 [Liparis tanakae]|uniref:Uncharacterized protein n=1 Tax=Liparis tanakae TaxID=230148 RepID=A0A4Z2G039_9TELE|nr:hypothetical protein EYF80_042923 [Liparis tanakae]